MNYITIRTPFINLDQLLKLAGIADSGGQAKMLILENMVKLNNATVIERRKKVYVDDIVEIEGLGKWQVIKSE